MVESGRYRGRSALTEAAERLEMVARGVQNRHLAQVGRSPMVPPSSTLYVRSDETFDQPLMNNPAQNWAEMSAARQTIVPQQVTPPRTKNRGWRYYMPLPVRWVMGWP